MVSSMQEIYTTVRSVRNTDIPVTEIHCEGEAEALAVFVHGFKAERTEGGRFLKVARELADHGFDSIMMDQSGCGESSEPFDNYCLDNSLADVECCIEHILKPSVRRIVLVGYSMGGRVISAYSKVGKHQVDTLVLWTPGIMEAEVMKMFLYDADGNSLYEEARKNGYGTYYNSFDNTYIHLSKEFYDGLFKYDTMEYVSLYQGNIMFVHGLVDDTVIPEISIRAYNSLTTKKDKDLVLIWDANHGFGLWDNKPYQSDILTGKTVEFILKNSQK